MRFSYQANADKYDVDVQGIESGYQVTIGDSSYSVELNTSVDGALQLLVDGKKVKAHVAAEGNQRYVYGWMARAICLKSLLVQGDVLARWKPEVAVFCARLCQARCARFW